MSAILVSSSAEDGIMSSSTFSFNDFDDDFDDLVVDFASYV
eukprot:CAMPEP_0170912570 /NCGR_PEP_ID=MMETSP0735-20130129/4436_1 /TAXON_ID=186038 /ORGANISM="Fragilariopsis kerguelensis, Strain L26-C5" /LENGTH=40 /DNA_ID= /DNA_START= /DNA_END= /DNA_ORIENTATION=